MKPRIAALTLSLSLLLTGCGWSDGQYSSVTPHREQRQSQQLLSVMATNRLDLMRALEELIRSGSEIGLINVADYQTDMVKTDMEAATLYAKEIYPVGAYAVEDIEYEVGANGGLPAVAVTISYSRSRTELQMIRQVDDMAGAEEVVAKALENYSPGVVLLVDDYDSTDFSQLVQDYGEEHPDTVMEIPQVTAAIHGRGKSRVAELTFTYQTNRDFLRQMQTQVKPIFESAALYVSGDGEEKQKFSQLYAFLMERFDYKLETSITPAYSLLRHGVGDSRAFATVYAAMCRDAGLTCMVVTGTRSGEPWTWNIVLDDGRYYHVDLLRCSAAGGYRESADREMSGYVWDYSAYPKCDQMTVPQTETVLPEEEQTLPEEPTDGTNENISK